MFRLAICLIALLVFATPSYSCDRVRLRAQFGIGLYGPNGAVYAGAYGCGPAIARPPQVIINRTGPIAPRPKHSPEYYHIQYYGNGYTPVYYYPQYGNGFAPRNGYALPQSYGNCPGGNCPLR